MAADEDAPVEGFEIQVWRAFGGREQMLAAPASKVRRVMLYLQAQNEYEYEQQQEQQRKMEDAERERQRMNSRQYQQQPGRRY